LVSTATCVYTMQTNLLKSSQVNTILLQTPIVYTKDINKKVMEFVKGKSKGTNPAIMGNPIDMRAVNAANNNQSYY